jgi:hypothetical protein
MGSEQKIIVRKRIYDKGDIMKKIDLPDNKKEWDTIFESMDNKKLTLSTQEVEKEVAACRKK